MKYVFALLLTSLIHPLFAEDAPNIETKAGEVMDRLVAYYQSMDRFEVDYELHASGTPAPDVKVDERVPFHVAMDRSGRFAKVNNTDFDVPLPNMYYGDGVGLVVVGNKAVKVSSIKSLDDFLTHTDLGYMPEFNVQVNLDIRADLIRNVLRASWKPFLASAMYKGEEMVDEKPAHHLQLNYVRNFGGRDMATHLDTWISTGDQPLLLKISETEGDWPMAWTGTYTNWKVNQPIEASVFQAPDLEDLKVFDSYNKMVIAESQSPAEAMIGTKAPDFTLDQLDGSPFTLSEQQGKKVVILDFWATWCGPCVEALPDLMAATEKYKDRDVILVAVNQQEEAKRIERFLTRQKWTLDVALDEEGRVGGLYNVQGIPQTVIVGKDGKIKVVHVGSGPGMREVIAGELDEILAEK